MAYLHLVLDNEYEAIDSQSEDDFVDPASPTAINGGENIVFYGAPGTGKTHTVNELVGDDLCVRTVFHPDTQNSDFVGTLKPVMDGVQVTYSFSPGPFSIAFRDAIAHPDRKVFLVIEELNRAPAAAVFGELFLLLDRDSLGKGKYSVQFQTNEFRDWVNTSVGHDIHSITLPSNLWIIATMNSADQGVYPLDTAFRRRWQHIYVPIDYSLAPKGKIEIVRSDGSQILVDWCDFAKILNNHLTENLQVPEDRLLGPWFVSSDDLDDHGKIPSKVLIYLWDDLLRHHDKSILFDTNIVRMFGTLSSMVDHSEKIFSDSFLINFPAEK